LLMAIADRKVFFSFFDELVERSEFSSERDLVIKCVQNAANPDPEPFLEVLLPENSRTDNEKISALLALRALKTESGDEVRGKIRDACSQLMTLENRELVWLAKKLLSLHDDPKVSSDTEGYWIDRKTGMEFVFIPPGSFEMGSDSDSETYAPAHRVTFERGFWIGKYPVTNAQFRRFVEGGNAVPPEPWDRATFSESEQPVVGVSWENAVLYCKWVGRNIAGSPGKHRVEVRLPSESQWEFAARGPDSTPYPWGDAPPTDHLANFGNSLRSTSAVGLRPNGGSKFGVQDLAGNVLEWCADHWHPNHTGAPEDGSPRYEGEEPSWRVVKGGAWDHGAPSLLSYSRLPVETKAYDDNLGFRVAAVERDSRRN